MLAVRTVVAVASATPSARMGLVTVRLRRSEQSGGQSGEDLLTPSAAPRFDRLISWIEMMVIAAALVTALLDTPMVAHRLLLGGLPHLVLGQLNLRAWWWWSVSGLFSHGVVALVLYMIVYAWPLPLGIPALAAIMFLCAMAGLLAQNIIRMSAGIPSRHLLHHAGATTVLALVLVAAWLI